MIILVNEDENEDVKIKQAYNGIMINDCRKWFYLLEFLKLTKSKDNIKIGEILGKKAENIRKQIECYKKAEYYLSTIKKCNKSYYSLNLRLFYFQKIHITDWNEVLINLNRIVQNNIY